MHEVMTEAPPPLSAGDAIKQARPGGNAERIARNLVEIEAAHIEAAERVERMSERRRAAMIEGRKPGEADDIVRATDAVEAARLARMDMLAAFSGAREIEDADTAREIEAARLRRHIAAYELAIEIYRNADAIAGAWRAAIEPGDVHQPSVPAPAQRLARTCVGVTGDIGQKLQRFETEISEARKALDQLEVWG